MSSTKVQYKEAHFSWRKRTGMSALVTSTCICVVGNYGLVLLMGSPVTERSKKDDKWSHEYLE